MDGQGATPLPVHHPLLFKASMREVQSSPSNLKAQFLTHSTISKITALLFYPHRPVETGLNEKCHTRRDQEGPVIEVSLATLGESQLDTLQSQ